MAADNIVIRIATHLFSGIFFVLLMLTGYLSAGEAEKPQGPLPKTVDEAVEYILKDMDQESIKKLRATPCHDLIKFHFGWGMGIRNSLGLWQKDSPLRRSCAKRVGQEDMHPDEASGIIIEAVWQKANNDIPPLNLSKLSPEKYFSTIREVYEQASEKSDVRPLMALPKWLFLRNWANFMEKPDPEKVKHAQSLLAKQHPDLPLALLYLSYYSKGKDALPLCEKYLNDPTTKVGSFPVQLEGDDFRRPHSPFVLDQKVSEDLGESPFSFKEFSMADVALGCINSVLDESFKTPATYFEWKELTKSNPALESYETVLSESDIDILIKFPVRLLKTLILTQTYANYDEKLKEFYGKLYEKLKSKMPSFKEVVYHETLQQHTYYTKKPSLLELCRQLTASMIPDEKLVEMLSPEEEKKHEQIETAEHLLPYEYLITYLLRTQTERLLRSNKKALLYPAVEKVLREHSYQLPERYYYTYLLFALDSKRTDDIYIQSKILFDPQEPVKKKEYSRQDAFLRTMIRYYPEQYYDFAEKWFFVVGCKDKKIFYNQQKAILESLAQGDEKAKALRNKLMSDTRYLQCQ